MAELAQESARNHRLMKLNINMPVEYLSNVALTPETTQYYYSIPDWTRRLRELVCDNIQLELLSDFMPRNMFTGEKTHFSPKEMLSFLTHFIKNTADFDKYLIEDLTKEFWGT